MDSMSTKKVKTKAEPAAVPEKKLSLVKFALLQAYQTSTLAKQFVIQITLKLYRKFTLMNLHYK